MKLLDRLQVLSNRACPIGVDLGQNALKVAQLKITGKNISLVCAGIEVRPAEIKPGSAAWQRWAIESARKLTGDGEFSGREVISALPATDVYIDHLKVPRVENKKSSDVLLSKIQEKLPFPGEDSMVKYIPSENGNVVIMATERSKVERHLAIYERANLTIKSIAVWPVALLNTYTSFFGRRSSDFKSVVMLLDASPKLVNVVICRHRELLFARSIAVGTKDLSSEEMMKRLMLELTACKRHFGSMYRSCRIERLVFLSGETLDRETCALIARQMEMPAQMGNCMEAVEIENTQKLLTDGGGLGGGWAESFGLSLYWQ